ncbi:MAG: sensor histidine kinase [Verrucomicrobia bacterium]|nr:sensor histidine kinase [Verrucomicrobiota bacterium]
MRARSPITALFHACLGGGLLALAAAGALAQPADVPAAITSALQLRHLAPTNAARRVPVHLRAVVTAVDWQRTVFIQDETGGTFFSARPAGFTLNPGDKIELRGVTYAGLFVPGINTSNVQRLGRAELPPAVPATYDDLLSGRCHYQRVEVVGVVRAVETVETNAFSVTLALGPRKLEVRLRPSSEVALPRLVDAQVRVTGLAAGYINDKRQIVAPQVFINDLSSIRVEQPPPEDPFSAPVRTAAELLNFNPDGASPHRVVVRAVVTHQRPGEALFLREAGRGLHVQTRQLQRVQPGDVVEVAGFPAMGTFSALLEDAEFRKVGNESEPAPLRATVKEVLKGANDADLVTLDAQLLEVLQTPTESVLLLRAGDTAFNARLARTPLELRGGSQVRLTGVCRVEESTGSPGFRANPRTVELLLRSPADIAVISAPNWWTAQRLTVAAVSLLVLAAVALAWVALLQRRVAEQTEVISSKVEREAILEERQRVAREMHDTLAQSFSGLGFQLDALAEQLPREAEPAQRRLETAKQMVRHGQEEFRRSLMNLRAQELERGSLATALPELARQITAGTGIELRCDVRGTPRGLPEAVEMNLLRIGQECLTNVVQHAGAKHIEIELRYDAAGVRLRVADDGAGFSPQSLPPTPGGHFGWRGIRERAEQIRAKVDLSSQPGRGTEVIVTCPA